jgi:serine protease Do
MLRAGDLILAFDGKPVRDSHDLPKLVGATEAGISVDIDILRQGAEISVVVKIGELETERHAANTNASVSRDGAESERLSATVTALSPESRRALGLDDTVNGAVITSLETDGTAAKAGLKVGDVIVQVGSTPVTSAAELNAALDEAHTTSALLLVNRRGGPFFVGVKLSA